MFQSTRQETDEMIFQAGIGTAQLSRAGLVVARLYHWIIAGFTIAIILLAAVSHAALPILIVWLALYLIYFAARKVLTPRGQRLFYHPTVQFIRGQIGIVAVVILIYLLGLSAEVAGLWLLFILVLQMISKHCTTPAFLFSLVEVWIALVATRLLIMRQAVLTEPAQFVFIQVAAQCLWIGMLAFMVHYLVRNIDARQDTIAGYELVNALSDKLETLTDAQAKWKAILDTCLQVVQGASGSLWICDYKTQEIKLFAQSRPERMDRRPMRPVDNALPRIETLTTDHVLTRAAFHGRPCYYVVSTETVLYQDGTRARMPCSPGFRQLHSLLLIPILATPAQSGKTLALLCIGYDRTPRPRRVILDYQNLLSSMVYRIRPLFEFEQHLQELEALQAISRQVSQGVDLNQVLDSILAITVSTLGFEFAVVYLVEPGDEIIQARRGTNVPDGWIKRATFPLKSANIRADVIRTGRTEIVDGWDERLNRKLWKNYNQKALVRVFTPITIIDSESQETRTIGVVEAGCHKTQRSAIDEQQVAMLQPFVNQVAIAIEKAQLLDRMEKETEALTSLHSVSRSIAAARDRPHVWNEIGLSARRVLQADFVMLYPYNEDEHTIQSPQVFGELHGDRPLDYSLKETGILAKIIHDKTAYYAPDATTDPNLTHSTDAAPAAPSRTRHRSFTQRQNVRSFAGLPLQAGDHIVGIMCVNYRRRRQFAEDEKRIHDLFAQHAAIAMNNAAINDLERRLSADQERSRLYRELHEWVAQYLPAIKFMAATAQAQLTNSLQDTQQTLEKIGTTAQEVLDQVDFTLFRLTPVDLERGLVASVEADSQYLRQCFGTNIQVEARLDGPSELATSEAIYMTVREAITNSARHSQASRVLVRLRAHNEQIYFLVHDDGRGFDLAQLPPRRQHGLNTMRERMRSIGGNLHIKSTPGKGAIVRGRAPMWRSNHDQP